MILNTVMENDGKLNNLSIYICWYQFSMRFQKRDRTIDMYEIGLSILSLRSVMELGSQGICFLIFLTESLKNPLIPAIMTEFRFFRCIRRCLHILYHTPLSVLCQKSDTFAVENFEEKYFLLPDFCFSI